MKKSHHDHLPQAPTLTSAAGGLPAPGAWIWTLETSLPLKTSKVFEDEEPENQGRGPRKDRRKRLCGVLLRSEALWEKMSRNLRWSGGHQGPGLDLSPDLAASLLHYCKSLL